MEPASCVEPNFRLPDEFSQFSRASYNLNIENHGDDGVVIFANKYCHLLHEMLVIAPLRKRRPKLGAKMATYRLGSAGAEVEKIQAGLNTRGFYSGPLDGMFGGGTEAGVRGAQCQARLRP